MSARIINLTEHLVRFKVDEILVDYPQKPYQNPYQRVFSKAYIREKIVAQVVNRIRSHYMVLQDAENLPAQWYESFYSEAERAEVDRLVQERFAQLIHEKTLLESSHLSLQPLATQEPSGWFG
jgi:hypothetical protein